MVDWMVEPSQDVWFGVFLTLVPALCSRLFAPTSLSFGLSDTDKTTETAKNGERRAKWQSMWRSQSMCVLLVILLARNYATLDCARLVFWYMAIDFACASWEVGGDLKWDNWVHHGSSLILTGVPLMNVAFRPVAEAYGRPFLWMEWTTILLNCNYMAKFYAVPSWIGRGLAYTFMASFFATRCLFLTHYVATQIPFGSVPLSVQTTIFLLTAIQWLWFHMMVRKLQQMNEKKYE